ncbi:MAG: patatin-like phospholipase family protein [Muribaculaceae bacterium]|nr:patatin-like phospholipase family protein [Muribaculaceae bacterium]
MKASQIKNNLATINGLLKRIGLLKQDSLGVAFGGGGAKGFSHIGTMMVLRDLGIRPTVLSGVSAGSVAAVLYAAGLTPAEIRECFVESRNLNDFREWTVPKDGFFKLDRFAKLLESWLPVKNLEELQIPTVVCATNLTRGTQVGWCKGEIVPRVMASCSMPVIFKPWKIGSYYYVDGGVMHNLPAWAIRNYCTTLIGCNCSPLDRTYKYKDSIVDIALRAFSLGMKANVVADMNLCDYVVIPRALEQSNVFDLASLDRNIRYGYEAAAETLKNLKK